MIIYKKILYIFIFLLLPGIVFAAANNGTIDSSNKWAWSERIGWINFAPSSVGSGNEVHVTDTAITGYAWSSNYGWINLSPTTSGITNDGSGVLEGNAWGENLGWIDFNGVNINSSGDFTGIASGTVTGRINFDCTNCKVSTDWRPSSSRPLCNNILDDDSDGKADYPTDPGCSSLTDDDETDPVASESCANGTDDDSDGKIDFPSDPGCLSASDTDETDASAGSVPVYIIAVPTLTPGQISITINDLNTNTGSGQNNVEGNLPAGGRTPTDNLTSDNRIINKDRTVSLNFTDNANIANISFSNTPDFLNATQEIYKTDKKWDLCSRSGGAIKEKNCPDGEYTVYIKFYDRFGRNIGETQKVEIVKAPTKVKAETFVKQIIKDEIKYAGRPEVVDGGEDKNTEVTPFKDHVFKRNLKLGMSGDDVLLLQKFLNSNGFIIASKGLGSPGKETNIFTMPVKKALARFQNKYADYVLKPRKLKSGNGELDTVTRDFINSQFKILRDNNIKLLSGLSLIDNIFKLIR